MNYCKNRYCTAAKTNTASGAIGANISLTERDIAPIAPCSAGKRPETAPAKPEDRITQPNRYWPLLADMPVLAHWPNRDEPFDYARSEVIAWVRDRFGVTMDDAIRIFNYARYKKVVIFDPITKLWCGTKGGAR
jgi:hypothetical protein